MVLTTLKCSKVQLLGGGDGEKCHQVTATTLFYVNEGRELSKQLGQILMLIFMGTRVYRGLDPDKIVSFY